MKSTFVFFCFIILCNQAFSQCDINRIDFCQQIDGSTTFESNEVERPAYGSNCLGSNVHPINTFKGPDKVFYFDVFCTSTVTIDLFNLTTDLDIFLLNYCPIINYDDQVSVNVIIDLNPCIAIGIGSLNADERITTTLTPGRYFLVIDGPTATHAGPYSLKLSGQHCGTSCFDCSQSTPLQCNQTVSGNNFSANNDFTTSDYQCQNFSSQSSFIAGDVVYDFEVTNPGINPFTFQLSGLQNDLDLFLFDGCPTDGGNCMKAGTNSNTTMEFFGENLSPGKYYLVVDGYNSDQLSSFNLKVSGACEQPTQDCSTCMQPLGDLPNGNILRCENFDNLNTGGIASQSAQNWRLWNSNSADAFVQFDGSGSGNHLRVYENAGNQSDVIYQLGNKTSGRYRLSWDMFVESDKGGYYNIQHEETGGLWATEVFFSPDGTGQIQISGTQDSVAFNYYPSASNKIMHIVDIDQDIAEFWLNNQFIYSWQFSNGSTGNNTPQSSSVLGGINFYAPDGNDYRVDKICIWEANCFSNNPTIFVNNDNVSGVCLNNGLAFPQESDARCHLYTSAEWGNCETICDYGGITIQQGDRFSSTLTPNELAPSFLKTESCIQDNYPDGIPQNILAEVFVVYHEDDGDNFLSFENFNSTNNDLFTGYVFECICDPNATDPECPQNIQNCLGSFDNNGAFGDDLAPGFYYVVILSEEAGGFGFDVFPENENCLDLAGDITCPVDNLDVGTILNDKSDVFNVNAAGLQGYFNCYSGVRNYTGNDVVYPLTVPFNQFVTIDLEASQAAGWFLFNYECGERCIAFAETPIDGGLATDTVQLNEGVYYLAVDMAEAGGNPSVTLNIKCVEDETSVYVVFDNDGGPPCETKTEGQHAVVVQETAFPGLTSTNSIIFSYPDSNSNYQTILEERWNEDASQDFLLPGDSLTDNRKCSYEISDSIAIAIGSAQGRFRPMKANFQPVSTDISATSSFLESGRSVITGLTSTGNVVNFGNAENRLTSTAGQNTIPIFWPSSVDFAYSILTDDTDDWLTVDITGYSEGDTIPRGSGRRLINFTLEENTGPAPREARLRFYTVQEPFLNKILTINQAGACTIPPFNVVASETEICLGESVTIAVLDLPAEWLPFLNFDWSNGKTGFSITETPGENETYVVNISKTECGASANFTTDIIVNSAPLAPTKVSDEQICQTQTFPQLSVTVSEPGVTVNWYDAPTGGSILAGGQNTTSFRPNAGGTFYAEASNTQTRCNTSARTPVTLTINPTPSIDAGQPQANICIGQTLQLTGNASGSATQYSWTSSAGGSFSNSQILNPVYTPPPGTHNNIVLTLTGKDPSGICADVSDQISLRVSDAPQITSVQNVEICEGENPSPLTVIVDDPSATVNWYSTASGGQPLPGGTNTTSFTPPTAGTYFAEANDSQGNCTVTNRTPVTMTVVQKPTANAGQDRILCENGNLQLNGNFGGSADRLEWSTASGGSFSNSRILNPIFSAPTGFTGNLQLTLTTREPSGVCPAATDQVLLTVKAQPETEITIANTEACAGDPISISGTLRNGAQSASWRASVGGGFFQNSGNLNTTYTPPASGVNEVTLFLKTSDPDNVCPDFEDSQLINLQERAQVEAGNNQVICAGTDFILNGTVGGSATRGTWSANVSGGIFLPNADDLRASYRPPVGVTNIQLTLTTNNPFGACPAASDVVNLQVQPAPTINPTDTVCSPNRMSYDFEFSTSGGSISVSSGTVTNLGGNQHRVVGADANQPLIVSVTDNNPPNCVTRFTVVNPNCGCNAITAPVGIDEEICNGDPIPKLRVNVLSGFTADWYDVSVGGSPIATGVLEFQPSVAGVFYVAAREIVSGCLSTERTPVRITTNPLPPANAGSDKEICPGSSVEITAPGDPMFNYSWSNGTQGQTFTVQPTSDQTFTLFVDDGDCQNSDEIQVKILPEVIGRVNVTEPIDCNGGIGDIIADVTNGVPDFTFKWSNGSVFREQIGLLTGDYSVVITDKNGCMDTVDFDFPEPAAIDFIDLNVTDADNGSNGSITGNVMGGTAPYDFDWERDGAAFQGGEDIFNLSAGIYSLIITDFNSCVFNAGEFTIRNTSSIADLRDIDFIKIFPNPTGGELFIQTEEPITEDFEFFLFDALGKLIELPVEKQLGRDGLKLDISGNAAGIYFLKIKSGEREFITKVILN